MAMLRGALTWGSENLIDMGPFYTGERTDAIADLSSAIAPKAGGLGAKGAGKLCKREENTRALADFFAIIGC